MPPDPRFGESGLKIESDSTTTTTHHALRCSDCGKLLAELISEPFSIVCGRCKSTNSAGLPTKPS